MKRFFRSSELGLVFIGAFAAAISTAAQPAPSQFTDTLVYFGTYTGGDSQGIYVCRLRPDGTFGPVRLAAESANPSFLAMHPNGRRIYAVNEVGDFAGEKSGGVSAYSIEPGSGKLNLLNQQASKGQSPCHLVVDRAGKFVLVANYGGGSATVLPILEDGQLGEAVDFVQHEGSSVNPRRQQGPHAHSINLDSANRFAFVADLGLDQVLVYKFDTGNGALTPNPSAATVKPGSGPRHFAMHPSQSFAYVINEMHSTVTGFAFDSKSGRLTEFQTISTLPSGEVPGNSTAEVQVHPSGKFLYGSNRGHDSIAVFSIDQTNGRLSRLENESTQGKTPRNFGIDPAGRLLLAANQNSGTVVVFRIDQESGELEPTGQILEVPRPVCVKFVPAR